MPGIIEVAIAEILNGLGARPVVQYTHTYPMIERKNEMTQKILKIDADGLPGDTVEFFHNDGVFKIKMNCPEFGERGMHLTDKLPRKDVVRLRDWLTEILGEG